MNDIQSIDNGVRAWTRPDHPGQGKALGHTKNKHQASEETPTTPEVQAPVATTPTEQTGAVNSPESVTTVPTEPVGSQDNIVINPDGPVDILV